MKRERPKAAPADRLARVRLLGFDIAACTVGEFLHAVRHRAESGRGGRIGYLNAHTVNLARDSAAYRSALAEFDLLYADGMSIVRLSQRIGKPLPERVNAGDFLTRFCWMAAAGGLRVALIGSRREVVERAAQSLAERVPPFQPCLVHHGHFERGSAEEAALLESLRAVRPHVVLVGMGSPRQEFWASECARELPGTVWWCVGALFEYQAGRARAPVWMRRLGLEWLFRLMLEPRRLAGRYLVGNARFVLHAMSELRGRKRRPEA